MDSRCSEAKDAVMSKCCDPAEQERDGEMIWSRANGRSGSDVMKESRRSSTESEGSEMMRERKGGW